MRVLRFVGVHTNEYRDLNGITDENFDLVDWTTDEETPFQAFLTMVYTPQQERQFYYTYDFDGDDKKILPILPAGSVSELHGFGRMLNEDAVNELLAATLTCWKVKTFETEEGIVDTGGLITLGTISSIHCHDVPRSTTWTPVEKPFFRLPRYNGGKTMRQVVMQGDTPGVRVLLKNPFTPVGSSALVFAVRSPEIVALLLGDNRVCPKRCHQGRTALSYALMRRTRLRYLAESECECDAQAERYQHLLAQVKETIYRLGGSRTRYDSTPTKLSIVSMSGEFVSPPKDNAAAWNAIKDIPTKMDLFLPNHSGAVAH